MEEKRTRCAFSVKYHNPEHPGEYWAADWDWEFKRQWARSWTEMYSMIYWHPEERLDKYAYEAILEKFGLKEWQDSFSMEKVQYMSPAQLADARRVRESTFKRLERLEIISDTLGAHCPAEEYE